MKTLYTILDQDGFEKFAVSLEDAPAENHTTVVRNEVFTRPRFNGESWEEGATAEEIVEVTDAKIAELKADCRRKLLPTDWYVIRKLERNVDIPEEISTARSATLDEYNNQIEALNSNVSQMKLINKNQ